MSDLFAEPLKALLLSAHGFLLTLVSLVKSDRCLHVLELHGSPESSSLCRVLTGEVRKFRAQVNRFNFWTHLYVFCGLGEDV